MIASHKLRKRDIYLNKLIAFQDTEPIKVVTGIRRCGKSSLLKLMAAHLRENGVNDEQIIEINFESYEFIKMTSDDLYQYVKERSLPGKRMYLFFDELQRMAGWENTINAFRVDLDCDIYITGSNAYLLSSEYSTYLSGRCVEIKMLPLSFAEFIDFHGFTIQEVKSTPGSSSEPITSRNPAATLTTIEIISFLQKDDTAVTRNVNISRNTSLSTNVITRAPKSVILNGHISNSCKAYIGAEKPSKP